jgi:hypothetical protein
MLESRTLLTTITATFKYEGISGVTGDGSTAFGYINVRHTGVGVYEAYNASNMMPGTSQLLPLDAVDAALADPSTFSISLALPLG